MTRKMKIAATGCLVVFLVQTLLRAAIFAKPLTKDQIVGKLAELPSDGNRQTKIILYIDLGDLYYHAGQMSDGAVQYEKALSLYPSNSAKRHIYLYLGKCYESSGRLDKAVLAYEEAAHYDSKNWKRHRDLGLMYEQLQLYSKAIESYEEAIKYNPKEASVYFNLGETWRKIGLFEKAERNFILARDLGYKGDDLNRELSYVYEAQGRYADSASRLLITLSSASKPAEWGRLIYLATLGGDHKTANQGLDQLKELHVPIQTLSLYEELVELIHDRPTKALALEITDPSLRSLISSIISQNPSK